MITAFIVLVCCLLMSLAINCLLIRTMQKEHRDECTRLMCKNAGEFKSVTEGEKEVVKTAHQNAIDEWRAKGKR